MSILPRTGVVQVLATPGNFIAASNLPINSCCEILRGHCSRGFSTTTVFRIERAPNLWMYRLDRRAQHPGYFRLAFQNGRRRFAAAALPR